MSSWVLVYSDVLMLLPGTISGHPNPTIWWYHTIRRFSTTYWSLDYLEGCIICVCGGVCYLDIEAVSERQPPYSYSLIIPIFARLRPDSTMILKNKNTWRCGQHRVIEVKSSQSTVPCWQNFHRFPNLEVNDNDPSDPVSLQRISFKRSRWISRPSPHNRDRTLLCDPNYYQGSTWAVSLPRNQNLTITEWRDQKISSRPIPRLFF